MEEVKTVENIQTSTVTKMSPSDISQRLKADKDGSFVNEYLSGKIVSEIVPVAQPVVNSSADVVVPPVVDSGLPPITDERSKEIEEYSKKIAESEDRIRKEYELREEATRRADEIKKELETAKAKQISIEKELEELRRERESARSQPPVAPVVEENPVEDDPTYANDYEIKTRKLLLELRGELANQKQTPEIVDKVNMIEQSLKEQSERQKKIDEEKARHEQIASSKKAVYDEVRDFQKTYKEFKTNEDIEKIEKEFLTFRSDVARAVNAKNDAQTDAAIETYLNGKSEYADNIRKKISDEGAAPPKEIDTFLKLSRIVDLKHGIEIDSVTGEEKLVKDRYGREVRYRSLDEAYKVSNYYDEMSKARREESLKLQEMINQRNNTAVVLSNTDTAPVQKSGSVSKEYARKLLALHPRQYENDPKLYEEVRELYNRLGMQVPSSHRY